MSQDTPPDADFSPIGSLSEKSKKIQLAITGALVIFIIVIAGALLYIRYRPKSYKPNTVNTTTSIYFVDTKAAKATLALRSSAANPNSKFVYIILNDAELKALLLQNSVTAKPLSTQDHRINMWPNQATGQSLTRIDTIKESNDPRIAPVHAITNGSVSGFLATRLEEGQPMFRVNMTNSMFKSHPQQKRLEGNLLYEDQLPAGHLVFLAELDDETFEVIVIDAK